MKHVRLGVAAAAVLAAAFPASASATLFVGRSISDEFNAALPAPPTFGLSAAAHGDAGRHVDWGTGYAYAIDPGQKAYLNSVSFGAATDPGIKEQIKGLISASPAPNLLLSVPSPNLAVPTPLPEPASWAMMIAGFGLIGGAMRARRLSKPEAA